MSTEFRDPELDRRLAQRLMGDTGTPAYTGTMTEAWRVVEKMIRQHHMELKLDVFLGVSGENWRASFYSPNLCQRWEARGKTAPMAICLAAWEAFQGQVS